MIYTLKTYYSMSGKSTKHDEIDITEEEKEDIIELLTKRFNFRQFVIGNTLHFIETTSDGFTTEYTIE